MLDSRFSLLLYAPNTFATMILVIVCNMASYDSFAQEIEFATRDGKYKTRGSVASFVNANGSATKLPRSLTPDTQVVIKLQDGATTLPIQLSKLSDKTRTAITKFVLRERKGDPGNEPDTVKATAFFLNNQQRLMALAQKHSDLGPMHQVDSAAKEQYLTELRDYKDKLGPNAASDWAVRFTLAYFEGEYGENKYGEIYLIAKNTRDFWIAWQTAIVYSLRYRESITDCIKLMDLYLAELSQHANQQEIANSPRQLQNSGRAALWLRETAAIVQQSGLANEAQLKRLKQIQVSATVGSLIGESEIPDNVLDAAAERRRQLDSQRLEAETEALRIKELALDKRIRECADLLDQFMQSYNKQWEYGIEAFDRQAVITSEAEQNFKHAEHRWQSSSRSYIEWSIRANRDLAEDAPDFEIRDRRNAQERADFYLRERDRAYYEKKARLNFLYAARQKLAQTHAILANFVNRGKNQMILFENHYVDTIKADPSLKQVYLKFTDKLKGVIAQLPPMPTVMLPPKNEAKLEAQALNREQRKKIYELSFSLTVDLHKFLDELSTH